MRKWGWVIESREWGWDGEELEVRKGSYCGLPVISHLEKKKKTTKLPGCVFRTQERPKVVLKSFGLTPGASE